jgi:hypothetical protein
MFSYRTEKSSRIARSFSRCTIDIFQCYSNLFQGEIENQGTFADMQNSGLNFAKLLAKEEVENDADDTSEISVRISTKSGINAVSRNK